MQFRQHGQTFRYRSREFFCSFSEGDEKNIQFFQKRNFPQNFFCGYAEMQSWQIRWENIAKRPRVIRSMSEIDNYYIFFQKWIPTKCSPGHVESSFDITAKFHSLETDNLLPHSRKNEKITFSEKSSPENFCWTRWVQLWLCRKIFARRLKLNRSISENAGKKIHYFKITFSPQSFSGHENYRLDKPSGELLARWPKSFYS